MSQIAAIVLAAGKGTRMKSALPKVMHRIAGRSMVGHVLANLAPLAPNSVVVVVGPDMDAVAKEVAPHPTAIQKEQLGTGHAVGAAKGVMGKVAGTVLVIYGDSPFISTATLRRIVERSAAADEPSVVVLGMRPEDPTGYGRLVTTADDRLLKIVEHKDASAEERKIDLCNSGVMAVDGAVIWPLIGKIGNKNAKGEYYLTDIIEFAVASGRICAVVEAATEELIGVNSRAELAGAEALFQERRRTAAMDEGATLIDPKSVFFSADTKIGSDVVIGPNVVFGPGVDVADAVEIRAFCHIEGARIASGAVIGPFARLRPGTEIGENAHIGNFVEAKNAKLGKDAKANHLTYLGDVEVGAKANVGAGTITCNYDGFTKAKTVIGAGAFIGSNTALVAPVTVGPGAIIGAGSVITRDVEADALTVARGTQTDKPGWATKFRTVKQAMKDNSK